MSVAGASNILRAGTVLDGEDTLSDHLTGVRTYDTTPCEKNTILSRKERLTDDVNAKNTVSLSLSQELNLTLSIEVGLRTRVGRERELADLVLDASSLELLLGLADPSDLRVGVHDGGDGVVVDVPVTLADVLDGGNTLFFGLVREHRSEGDVTDALDVLHGRVELVVDYDAALVVELDADLLEVEALGVGSASYGDEDDIGFKLLQS